MRSQASPRPRTNTGIPHTRRVWRLNHVPTLTVTESYDRRERDTSHGPTRPISQQESRTIRLLGGTWSQPRAAADEAAPRGEGYRSRRPWARPGRAVTSPWRSARLACRASSSPPFVDGVARLAPCFEGRRISPPRCKSRGARGRIRDKESQFQAWPRDDVLDAGSSPCCSKSARRVQC